MMDAYDEEETVEYRRADGTGRAIIRTGLDMAWVENRGRYLRGVIEVDEFEAEVERIMRKRARLDAR